MSGVKKVERSRDALTVSGWLATVVLQHEIVQFRRKRAAISRSPGALTRGSNVGGHEKLPSDGHESARWRS